MCCLNYRDAGVTSVIGFGVILWWRRKRWNWPTLWKVHWRASTRHDRFVRVRNAGSEKFSCPTVCIVHLKLVCFVINTQTYVWFIMDVIVVFCMESAAALKKSQVLDIAPLNKRSAYHRRFWQPWKWCLIDIGHSTFCKFLLHWCQFILLLICCRCLHYLSSPPLSTVPSAICRLEDCISDVETVSLFCFGFSIIFSVWFVVIE